MKGYTFSEVKPRIFFLNFKDSYNMAMHFLRYQECYESPSPKFRGKVFTIFDYMEWYSKKYGRGAFTYTRDWGGFNIPADVPLGLLGSIPDVNKYDKEMADVCTKCVYKYPDKKFYLIGAVGKDGAMKHEIAHGFFYTQPEYKKEMTKLVKGLNPTARKKIYNYLRDIGYTPKVYIDECQAYLSTGHRFKVKLKGADKPFIQLFDKYYKETR